MASGLHPSRAVPRSAILPLEPAFPGVCGLRTEIDVAAWLDGLGLGTYAETFAEQAIDADTLADLSEQDLAQLGMPLGHRKRLLRAIADLAPQPKDAQSPQQAPADPASGRHARAQRRQLTVMFVDLVGSTGLAAQLDPEDLREVVGAYQDCCTRVIERFDGHVAKFLGDGVLAYFGYPGAHEDDAERAIRAGLDLVDAIGRLGLAVPLAARVGISTGEVVAGDLVGERSAEQQAVVGDTPNRAARLQALAEPGSVVIGPHTRALVGRLFDYADLGAHEIKGISQPVQVSRVLGPSTVADRFAALRSGQLSPLIGREHEIALLSERWEQARRGEGHVVLLTGEPGIGKSRVVQSLCERLENRTHGLLRYQCLPYYRHSAFQPLIEELERTAGIARSDAAEARLDKLRAHLATLGPAGEGLAAPLAELTSIVTGARPSALQLSPHQRKARLLAALLTRIESMAARRPLLIVVEDLHWIDPSSMEFLELLIDRVGALPVLVIVTVRPQAVTPHTGGTPVTALTLSPLSQRQSAALVAHMVPDKPLPAEVADEIVTKTEGVPLFVEELTKAVLDSGLLADQGDRYVLTGRLDRLAIPATLQDSLMARLDRLVAVKDVAQIAAVIGREFAYELLEAVAELPEEQLQDALAQLAAAGLVFRRGDPPGATYTFKHALVQETAYNALLRARREEIHGRIARALASDFPEVMETNPELIADHYTQAGLDEEAVEFWREAGDLAVARCAPKEAIAHLRHALALLERFPASPHRSRTELGLQTTLGGALIAARGFATPEVGEAYGRAQQLCQELGDNTRRFPALFGRWIFHVARSEMSECLAVADEMLQLADELGDTGPKLIAHRALTNTFFFLGDMVKARSHAETVLALYEPARHGALASLYSADSYVASAFFLAHSLALMGYLEQARRWAHAGLARARELAHGVTLAHALHHACVFHQLVREFAALGPLADELIALASEHGLAFWQALGRVFRGGHLVDAGRTDAGLEELRAGIAAYRATSGVLYLPYVLTLWAEACRRVGDHESGLQAIAEASALVDTTGVRGFEPYVHRIHATLLRDRGADAALVEATLERAIALARKEKVKLSELRATVELARLWQGQGRQAEARERLQAVYAWFGEGFHSADLRAAKTLLDALA
jgi:class 3 adenylate cyclase/predicted ATPase